jgi:hypothetical protein
MRFRDREERERYMDSLERQMEHERERIQRTLNRMEGSVRRRTALEKLRSSLANFPARGPAPDVEEREAVTERPDGEAPRRSWWGFWR